MSIPKSDATRKLGEALVAARRQASQQDVADAAAILRATRDCLRRVPFEKKIRLLGVRISTLCDPSQVTRQAPAQAELFPAL